MRELIAGLRDNHFKTTKWINFMSPHSTMLEFGKIFALSSSNPRSMNVTISSLTKERIELFTNFYQDWLSQVEKTILSCFTVMEDLHQGDKVSGVSPVSG
jgi:hypothetical protein